MDFVLAAELEKTLANLILVTSKSSLGSKVDNYIGLPNLNCLPSTAFDFWAILKVHDSVSPSLFLPMFNGIVFEVAVSQAKFELLVCRHTRMARSRYFRSECSYVAIIILFKGYRQKDEDGKVSDIQRMPVTMARFPERGFRATRKAKFRGR